MSIIEYFKGLAIVILGTLGIVGFHFILILPLILSDYFEISEGLSFTLYLFWGLLLLYIPVWFITRPETPNKTVENLPESKPIIPIPNPSQAKLETLKAEFSDLIEKAGIVALSLLSYARELPSNSIEELLKNDPIECTDRLSHAMAMTILMNHKEIQNHDEASKLLSEYDELVERINRINFEIYNLSKSQKGS